MAVFKRLDSNLTLSMKSFSAFALLALAFVSSAAATSYVVKPLKELVEMSDNIWGGTVVSVHMLNKDGRRVTNPNARTGPGLTNTIFLEVAVNPTLILKSVTREIPKKISIPLDTMRHFSLGDMQDVVGNESIFLLTKKLEPVYPANFERPLAEKKKIQRFITKL